MSLNSSSKVHEWPEIVGFCVGTPLLPGEHTASIIF